MAESVHHRQILRPLLDDQLFAYEQANRRRLLQHLVSLQNCSTARTSPASGANRRQFNSASSQCSHTGFYLFSLSTGGPSPAFFCSCCFSISRKRARRSRLREMEK